MPKQYLPLLGQPIALYRYSINHSTNVVVVLSYIQFMCFTYIANHLQFLHFLSHDWSQRNHCRLRSFLQRYFWRFFTFGFFHIDYVFCYWLLIFFCFSQTSKETAKQNSNLHCLEKKDRIPFTAAFRNVQFFLCVYCLVLWWWNFFNCSVISLAQFYISWGKCSFSYLKFLWTLPVG
jgi:hypothetical protein